MAVATPFLLSHHYSAMKCRMHPLKIMEWTPVVFYVFKFVVLGIGMFYAVKWHYDQGEKNQDKQQEKRAVLRAAGKLAVLFVLLLLILGLATFFLGRTLGLDLSMP
jgi:hypothetical protein